MIFYAHTAEDSEGRTLYTLKDGHQTTVKPRLADLAEEQVGWQPLRTHLLNVAQKARQLAEAFGLGEEGYVAGLLHDLGKYRTEFQTYLRGQCESSAATQHAIFGAAWAFDKELAASAFAVAGHHAGLHAPGAQGFRQISGAGTAEQHRRPNAIGRHRGHHTGFDIMRARRVHCRCRLLLGGG